MSNSDARLFIHTYINGKEVGEPQEVADPFALVQLTLDKKDIMKYMPFKRGGTMTVSFTIRGDKTVEDSILDKLWELRHNGINR